MRQALQGAASRVLPRLPVVPHVSGLKGAALLLLECGRRRLIGFVARRPAPPPLSWASLARDTVSRGILPGANSVLRETYQKVENIALKQSVSQLFKMVCSPVLLRAARCTGAGGRKDVVEEEVTARGTGDGTPRSRMRYACPRTITVSSASRRVRPSARSESPDLRGRGDAFTWR